MAHDSPYTFGDSDLAARRLASLAAVYRTSSERFITHCCDAPPERAIDLGCGPGHSTELLSSVTGAKLTIGVDSSEQHLSRARASAPPNIEYVQHDLRSGVVPVAKAQLVFERFLLTHLAEPAQRLAEFAELLAPGGTLLVQETSSLESDDPTLSRYYELVGAFQAHYRQTLYIGRELPQLAERANLRSVRFEQDCFEPSAATMAELHALNLRTWGRDPAAISLFGSDTLSELELELDEIVRGDRPSAAVRASTGLLVVRA
jgi:trans-aconitate 2-methyltransferase